jgi:hypothetical protein
LVHVFIHKKTSSLKMVISIPIYSHSLAGRE